MIILKGAPGLVHINVDLELDRGVALKDPELWIRQDENYAVLPRPEVGDSECRWAGIQRPEGEKNVALQLYWQAFDPLRPKWHYRAKVSISDQDGTKLDGTMGHENPSVLPEDLVDCWDHGQTGLYIYWGD